MNITPHFVVPDAAEAAAWYEGAFTACEQSRVPLPGGKVMAVVMRIGESTIHIGSEFPEAGILAPESIGGTATVLQINTEDAEALWGRAITAGATVRHPLVEQFWGERHGQLSDPFGHRWNIAQHIRDVSGEEIVAGAAKAYAGREDHPTTHALNRRGDELPTANKALFLRIHDAINSHDVEVKSTAIDELFAPDVVIHTPAPTDAVGRQAIKEVFAGLHRAFPDLHITTEDLIAEGDRVAGRNAVTGTHRGEYMGRPPTGKTVAYEEIIILRFAGERIAESWAVVDVLSQLRQLGFMSEEAS